MIIGRFGDTSGRPYIAGKVLIPNQACSTNISFLMDTGADQTVLMPTDVTKMGLDYDKLESEGQSRGVGGIVNDYLEVANVIFVGSAGNLYVYNTTIRIMRPSTDMDDIPSLIGRDILDKWSILYSPSQNELTATVHTASEVINKMAVLP